MELTIDQVVPYAIAAGFTGNSLRTIVAIAQAESGFDTTIRHTNAGGSVDRGILQINTYWHPEVTDAQCDDPAQAFVAGYRISKQGTNFSEWTTYKLGDQPGGYKTTPAWTQLANMGGVGPSIVAWSPAHSKATWPWLTNDGTTANINNPYHSSFETERGAVQDGVGIAVALDTPITSLTAGVVMAAAFGQDLAPAGANWNYGGFIVVKSQIPGLGYVDVFYRHMDVIQVKEHDMVQVGRQLGLSGGQLAGGQHPESAVFTTGAHLDVGLNPDTLPFTSIGANMDPTPWLNKLLMSGPPARDAAGLIVPGPVGTGIQNAILLSDQITSGTGEAADSFLSIEGNLDFSMQFIPIDWSTVSTNIHWWDYVLPWQWPYVADTAVSNLTTALFHNVGACLLRSLIILMGFVLFMAFLVGIILSFISEASQSQGGKAATQLAEVAVASA